MMMQTREAYFVDAYYDITVTELYVSHDDSTREGHTTAAPLGPPDDWGAQDIQDKFPGGKPTAVPGGGMPGGV